MNRARPILALALLALSAHAQAPAAPSAPARGELALTGQEGPLTLSWAELVLDQYVVQNVDPTRLFETAVGLVGRKYLVKENTGSGWVSNLRLLGPAIVLYDTKEQVQRTHELLARLDAPREGTVSSTSNKIVEYRPRFVSLDTAQAAIVDIVEYNVVPERSLIVMTDFEVNIEAAQALLERIDVAERQVLLTCQLVEVGAAAQGTPLAKELSENLQKLLPQSTFTQVGLAMLKTSVSAQSPVSVQIESKERSYRLSFMPVAFDVATGALTVSACSLVDETYEPRELFKTNTVLRGGEYTVLAATGATPRLLVVRVTTQG